MLWGAVGLQFAFALLILDTEFGKAVFYFTGQGDAKAHSIFQRRLQIRFGPLADGDLLGKRFGAKTI